MEDQVLALPLWLYDLESGPQFPHLQSGLMALIPRPPPRSRDNALQVPGTWQVLEK